MPVIVFFLPGIAQMYKGATPMKPGIAMLLVTKKLAVIPIHSC